MPPSSETYDSQLWLPTAPKQKVCSRIYASTAALAASLCRRLVFLSHFKNPHVYQRTKTQTWITISREQRDMIMEAYEDCRILHRPCMEFVLLGNDHLCGRESLHTGFGLSTSLCREERSERGCRMLSSAIALSLSQSSSSSGRLHIPLMSVILFLLRFRTLSCWSSPSRSMSISRL